MAELRPYPFAALVRRMLRELDESGSVFDLPASAFVRGGDGVDTGVAFQGRAASSPLGPAAGPHTQMAQNLALSWLGGSRIFELKTVQVMDELAIPRPCIDARTVGLNAEWSQELRIEQSLDEYVKGAMLIEILRRDPRTAPAPGFSEAIFDLSVGYDLAGIRSERVLAFMRGLMDARAAVDRLRRELPPEHAGLAGLDFPTRLSGTLTLSTFHGCPPGEIEGIVDFLMRELGLACTIKFNPTLLGPAEVREILHERLGYTDFEVPDEAFVKDTRWEQAVEMLGRLGETARSLGLPLGVKCSNTLIVRNSHGFLAPAEREVYLSGQPLHVLAIQLVRRFRRTFGAALPISFAAGIDRHNFPDAVALGLVPVTVCTDLLRKGGYARLAGYRAELIRRMAAAGTTTVEAFVRATAGGGADLDLEGAILANTERYADAVAADPRYRREKNASAPRKIGRHLKLFDCLTCDLCIPVCPNDANFVLAGAPSELPVVKATRSGAGWTLRREGSLALRERHQIGNFADFCNDCGNCDVFCPEDGGPYQVKPRFFGSEADWRADGRDGFFAVRTAAGDRVLGRIEGREVAARIGPAGARFTGPDFDFRFDPADPEGTFAGNGPDEVDVTDFYILDALRRMVLDAPRANYVQFLSPAGAAGDAAEDGR